ncbi:hypothetical protein QTP70_020646, partial [Hemibagrus guttatus]
MGKFGVKERNLEGQMVVDFANRMDMGVVNTYFQKREEHRVTYKSGGRSTQVDYILCRRGNLKEISDCKVVVGESVARQHRMVVCRMTLMVCKKKRSEIEKKTKWWKLKKEECCEEFRQKLRQALGGQVVLPDDWETTAEVIRETGRKLLGVSSGRRKEDKETWWWNEEVQDSIQRKRLAKKKWDMDRTEENRQEYKELQRRVKREVYTRLDTREGEKDLYRLARQRDRDGKDVQQFRVIKDRDGSVLTSEERVQRRWKEYFEELMNEENEREKRVEGVNSVEQKVDKIRKDEVRKALKRMKSGKAVGPDDIPVEVWKGLGEAAVEFLASLFNRVLESERMPEEWRRSVLVPIFKNKGDVQSCSNYRGIKLMSHTMKVWERVVEARLRKVVEICEQQYGFMPRKSTTDAIFALRILMEKYRDGQRELHCVFVDLEKAYDRVPREELWYCMRKSGVAEKYVRVVQDMYERSRTVVRCAVGQTEEFNVEVGLHQGSALSPFLFAIVMDQLSEEVRQESPWTMMFADDIVICSESREQVEENLERWRFALERRGMKVSRSKTEYMCVNEREGSGTVRLQGEEVKKVQEFKYLGSTVQSNGECGKEVKKRVQAGWNGWRKVSGVLCDQKISARIKGKVYRTVVRPAMLYGLETVSLRKRQESELEVGGVDVSDFTHEEAVEAIRQAGDKVELLVQNSQHVFVGHMLQKYASLPGELKLVELDCSTHRCGLGVCVSGSRAGRRTVCVSEIWPDGAAAADGQISVGDELLEINRQVLYGQSYQNAAALINSASSKVKIVLIRNKAALKQTSTGSIMEAENHTITSPSDVDIRPDKEHKHDATVIQEESMRSDKTKPCPAKSQSNNPPVSFIASSNHNPLPDPAPSFSHISPTSHVPPTSHNTAASHTHTTHHKQPYRSSMNSPSAPGVRSSSYCSECSVRSDPLTCPIIPGCINIIDICKGHSSLGLTIVGGCNTVLGVILIHEVNEGGAAHRDGRLMAGDHILEVNGIDLRMASHEEAQSVLRLSPQHVRLCVYRHTSTHNFSSQATHIHEDMWDLFTVDLQLHPGQELGLSIVGKRSDTGIFVSEIREGGVVESDGRLSLGDQILSVNGEDIRAVTQDYARCLLQ